MRWFYLGLEKRLVEELFALAPVGHAGVHEGVEAGAVVHVLQVTELVHDHVIQRRRRIVQQGHVQVTLLPLWT